MADKDELLRQYAAEFERIGISEEASRYFAIGNAVEDAISQLRTFPTGLGTDGFFRRILGVDFATWRRELEDRMASDHEAG